MQNGFRLVPVTLSLVFTIALGAAAWLHAEGSGGKPNELVDVDLLGDGGNAQLGDPDLVEMTIIAAQEDSVIDDEAGPDPTDGDIGPRCKDAFSKADKNGDGKLDADERPVAHSYLREFRRPGVEKRLEKTSDTNGDGKLDDTEKAQAKIQAGARLDQIDQMKAQVLLKWDANQDGHLDKDERAKLRDAWKKHLEYMKKKADADKKAAAKLKADQEKAAKDAADKAAADKKALDDAKKKEKADREKKKKK